MGAENGSGRRKTTEQVVRLELEQNSGGQVAQRPTKYDKERRRDNAEIEKKKGCL